MGAHWFIADTDEISKMIKPLFIILKILDYNTKELWEWDNSAGGFELFYLCKKGQAEPRMFVKKSLPTLLRRLPSHIPPRQKQLLRKLRERHLALYLDKFVTNLFLVNRLISGVKSK